MKTSSLSLRHMYPIKKSSLQVVSLHLVLIKKRGLPSYPSKKQDASCIIGRTDFVWFYSSLQSEKFSNMQSLSETVTGLGHFPFFNFSNNKKKFFKCSCFVKVNSGCSYTISNLYWFFSALYRFWLHLPNLSSKINFNSSKKEYQKRQVLMSIRLLQKPNWIFLSVILQLWLRACGCFFFKIFMLSLYILMKSILFCYVIFFKNYSWQVNVSFSLLENSLKISKQIIT